MSLTYATEEYYKKFIELQEKLRKSEEERLKLEMKFNEMMQVTREEEQMHYRKLRSQYKHFLDEDKRRQERNENILRALERIENRAAMLAAKTERIKDLRKQYHILLKRIYERPIIQHKQVEENLYEHPSVRKALEKQEGGESKSELLDKYLASINTRKNKQRQNVKIQEHLPFSLSSDNLTENDKLYSEYLPNAANTMADEILSSIHLRNKAKVILNTYEESSNDDDDSVDKCKFSTDFWEPKQKSTIDMPKEIDFNEENEKRGVFDARKSLNDYDVPNDSYQTKQRKFSRQYSKEKSDKENMDDEKKEDDILNQHQQKVGNELEETKYDLNRTNISEPMVSVRSDKRQIQLDQPKIQHDIQNVQNVQLNKIDDENMKKEKQPYEEKLFNNNKFETEKLIGSSKNKIMDDDILLLNKNDVEGVKTQENVMFNNKEENEELAKPVTENFKDYVNQNYGDTQQEVSEIVSTIEEKDADNQIEPKVVSIEGKQQQNHNDTQHKPETQQEEINKDSDLQQQNEQEPMEQFDSNQQYIQQYDQNDQPLQEYEQQWMQYDESGKPLQQYDENCQPSNYGENYQEVQQYDENGQPIQQYDENGQLIQQYDESGQPIQYDVKQFQQYDETGQIIQQYDANGQPIPQYDENGQLIQQYDDQRQPLQYDESGQLIQQYDNQGQPLEQYDENGQLIQQYDNQGQPLQQYDENGQPLQQYDGNGHLLQQYDENGQLIQQYDENGQPIQQYDENGQPINAYYGQDLYNQQYDEHGQLISQTYDQHAQQYNDNGQPLQHFEENNQLIEYDENGQPIQNYIPTEQYQPNLEVEQIVQQPQLSQKEEEEVVKENVENVQELQQVQEQKQQEKEDVKDKQEESKKTNVMEMLDTDTESTKQDTKVSHDSDFDFSNG